MFHSLIFNVEGRSLSRNLGPYRIAHWLRSKEWDVEVIDYILHWSLEELQELVESRVTKDTKFFGFSFLFSEWTDTVEAFAIWLKITYPNIPIISGSSGVPKKTITVDYHMWGFAEVALDLLLMYLFSNGVEPKYQYINGVKVINAIEYPSYPLENYSVSYQDRDFIQPWEFLAIETGRGCKFKCSFCNFPLLGVKSDHSTSADSFERELKENWERWGVTNYLITEETFNDRPEKIAKFAKVVSNLNFNPWFSAYIRLDLLLSRKDERHMLKEMNVLGQFYGVESFYQPSAKAIRKGMAPEKVKDGLLDLKQFFSDTNKYRGTISLIVGAPYEPKESLHDTKQWLISNWSDQAMKANMMVIPEHSENGSYRPSELTTSYTKYGYRPTTVEALKARHGSKFKDVNTFNHRIKGNVVWENDQMDMYEAAQIADTFDQVIKDHNFKKTTFSLAGFSGVGSTLEDKLSHNASLVGTWQEEENKWYDLYKFKKLCWRK